MTSKEALRYLTKALNLENYPTGTAEDYLADDYAFGCLKQLQSDIEVLETLKKYYKSDGWSNGGLIEFWKMPEKQLNKIWEWLKNDK